MAFVRDLDLRSLPTVGREEQVDDMVLLGATAYKVRIDHLANGRSAV